MIIEEKVEAVIKTIKLMLLLIVMNLILLVLNLKTEHVELVQIHVKDERHTIVVLTEIQLLGCVQVQTDDNQHHVVILLRHHHQVQLLQVHHQIDDEIMVVQLLQVVVQLLQVHHSRVQRNAASLLHTPHKQQSLCLPATI